MLIKNREKELGYNTLSIRAEEEKVIHRHCRPKKRLYTQNFIHHEMVA